MKRDRLTVRIAAIASTLSMALTVGTAVLSRTLDGGAALFGLLIVVLLLLTPYLVAVQVSRNSPGRRRWSRTAVNLYAVADVLLRGRVVFFPGSSTDGIALATIPIITGPLAFAGAALAVAVWPQISSASGE